MLVASLATTLRDWGLPANARAYFLLTGAMVVILIILETWDMFHRSMEKIQLTGFVLALVKVIAIGSTMLTLALLPFERLRWVMAVDLTLMGLLTVYRELRRRIRAGDHSPSSYSGGFAVVLQFLSFVLLAASGLAVLIELVIAPARLLESTMIVNEAIQSWVEVLATLLTLLLLYYVVFYITRRILNTGSFSWIDPPNWRTLLPHLKYTRKARWGLPPWRESKLADVVRETYIRHIAGSEDVAAIAEAARIQPVLRPERGFTFAVIGDPGEGDHSQIAPAIGQEEIQDAMDMADAPPANPGFIVISSDVVYPAGELMDYERTVYRPYRVVEGGPSPLIYGLPGNHDWYNNLKGLFLNFGYAAAHVESDDAQIRDWAQAMRTGPWARYGLPHGQLRWNEVAALRERYGLNRLGGDLSRPDTHQRLPFFELDFGAVPFVFLGVDVGCIGSIDSLQLAWLEDRLQAAYAAEKIIAVVLSEPLYVNGAFAEGEGMRPLYELLRRYEVHVVMGGDTHSYQHYEVRYIARNGQPHVAHHFVNGGGGAYLSVPVDLRWHTPTGMTPLESRFVYRDDEHDIVDRVILKSIFPTARDLRAKFTGQSEGWAIKRKLIGLEPRLLERGYTNALDHDRSPLLQSFVTLSMARTSAGWRLRVVPWFTKGPQDALQPQPPIDILAPNHTSPPPPAPAPTP
ncbi:MAG TPA: metallophosphoesterase, partial [Herpetosiphonaceae bacterium]|nr:metallophosphoesterase [Herpetosiphonaceae bacterium]